MGSTNIFKKINTYSLDNHDNFGVIERRDIKNISKNLCQAHKEGSLSTESLQLIIERLLACYIESDLANKFASKSISLNRKINKIYRQ